MEKLQQPVFVDSEATEGGIRYVRDEKDRALVEGREGAASEWHEVELELIGTRYNGVGLSPARTLGSATLADARANLGLGI